MMKLELTPADVKRILDALSLLPYREVAQLIQAIVKQAQDAAQPDPTE